MKSCRIFSIMMVLVFVSALTVPQSVWAGSKHKVRHRWEGAAIGLGALMVGSALLNPPSQAEPVRHHQPYQHHYVPPSRPCYPPGAGCSYITPAPVVRQGHWEWQKVWVAPQYREVWNPGYYDNCGHWVEGRWMEVEASPGYWKRERVWVAAR